MHSNFASILESNFNRNLIDLGAKTEPNFTQLGHFLASLFDVDLRRFWKRHSRYVCIVGGLPNMIFFMQNPVFYCVDLLSPLCKIRVKSVADDLNNRIKKCSKINEKSYQSCFQNRSVSESSREPLLNPISDPTWLHFGTQTPPQIRSKPIPKGIKIMINFLIDFGSVLAPFWGQK